MGHGSLDLANDCAQIPCRRASSPGRQVRSHTASEAGKGNKFQPLELGKETWKKSWRKPEVMHAVLAHSNCRA